MIRWFVRHWRDLALALLLLWLGATWNAQLAASYLAGATDRCAVAPW